MAQMWASNLRRLNSEKKNPKKLFCRPLSVFFPLIKVSPQFLIKGISNLKPLIKEDIRFKRVIL